MTLKELLKGKELPVKVTHKYMTEKYITITAYDHKIIRTGRTIEVEL